MGKHILMVTGSPHAKGTSNLLAEAFGMGAVSAGHEVKVFNAATAKVCGCMADDACTATGRCVVQDDWQSFYEMLNWADELVIVSPVYWMSFTSQIKRVIDRLYCLFYAPEGAGVGVKRTHLIATAMDEGQQVFDAMKMQYSYITSLLGWKEGYQLTIDHRTTTDDMVEEDIQKATIMGMCL